jgi:hypothetical protein
MSGAFRIAPDEISNADFILDVSDATFFNDVDIGNNGDGEDKFDAMGVDTFATLAEVEEVPVAPNADADVVDDPDVGTVSDGSNAECT